MIFEDGGGRVIRKTGRGSARESTNLRDSAVAIPFLLFLFSSFFFFLLPRNCAFLTWQLVIDVTSVSRLIRDRRVVRVLRSI